MTLIRGPLGKAEHPLGDDVALDLVAAAVQGVGAGEEEEVLPAIELVRLASGRQRVGARDLHRQLAQPPVPARPDQLGDVVGPGGRLGERPDGVDAHDLELGALRGEPVADDRVVEGAVAAGELDQVVELALEPDLLAEHRDAALEPEQRHRDLPAVARLADDHRRGRAGAGEEDLVELRAAGDLLDRADVDAVLVERHQEERQAVVPRRAELGAGDHEDPVGLVRPRGPDLLAVDRPPSSPSSTARVLTAARSEPAPGSE